MSKIENNKIYYDPYNEIICDKFALEKFVKESEEKDKIIADLESKLAESEKEANARYESWQEEIRECDRLRVVLAESEENNKLLEMQLQDMERSKLSWENQYFTLYNTLKNYREVTEKKLAESEEKCEEFRQAISKCTGELPSNVAFDISNDDIRYQIVCNLTDRNQEHRNTIKELKQKLAEKDDEITQRLVIQERDYNQDKISFAVEQLEKVKEFYTTPIYDRENPHTEVRVLLQRIDNQIKQLKEMN